MEPIEAEEPNTILLNVTKDMSKDDVLAEVLRRVEEIKAKERQAAGGVRLLEGYYKSDNHYCQTYKVRQIFTVQSFIQFNPRLTGTIPRARMAPTLSMLSLLSTETLGQLMRRWWRLSGRRCGTVSR